MTEEPQAKQRDCPLCHGSISLYWLRVLTREINLLLEDLNIKDEDIGEDWKQVKDAWLTFENKVTAMVGSIYDPAWSMNYLNEKLPDTFRDKSGKEWSKVPFGGE